MKKLLVSLIALVFAAAPASAQNLVLDGSFEGFVAVDSGWTSIAADGETFGAWTGHPSGVTHIWLYDDNGASASDGTASAHLGDGYTAASISQLVSGFTIGQTYEVSLAAIAYADGTSHPGGGLKVTDLDTALDDLDVTFAVNPGALGDPMIYSSFLFNASNTELELSISNPTDGYAMHTDDVSIHVAESAPAQEIAYDWDGDTGYARTNGALGSGNIFGVTEGITVTKLGSYNYQYGNQTPTDYDYPIELYEIDALVDQGSSSWGQQTHTATGTLIASVTIGPATAGDVENIGAAQYITLDTPVTLTAGKTYILNMDSGGTYIGISDYLDVVASDVVIGSAISHQDDYFTYAGPGTLADGSELHVGHNGNSTTYWVGGPTMIYGSADGGGETPYVPVEDLSTASVRYDWADATDTTGGGQDYASSAASTTGVAVSVNAANSDGLGTNSDGWNWTAVIDPAEGSMAPSATGVTMFIRYNAGVWANGTRHNTFTVGDGTCAMNPAGAYGIFASTDGNPAFDIGDSVNDGESDVVTTESISLGQNLDEGRWYDITGRWDPVAGTISIDVYDPDTGLLVGSNSAASSITSINMDVLGNEHGTWVTPCAATGYTANGTDNIEVQAIWQTALSDGDVAALSAI